MTDQCFYHSYDRKEHLHFESKAVHGALGYEPITGAVSFPIFQTATFRHESFDVSTGYYYSRLENPTRQELERTMAIDIKTAATEESTPPERAQRALPFPAARPPICPCSDC